MDFLSVNHLLVAHCPGRWLYEYLSRYSFRFGLGSVAEGSAYSTYSANTNQQANPALDWFSFEFLVVPLCYCVTLTGSDNGLY